MQSMTKSPFLRSLRTSSIAVALLWSMVCLAPRLLTKLWLCAPAVVTTLKPAATANLYGLGLVSNLYAY